MIHSPGVVSPSVPTESGNDLISLCSLRIGTGIFGIDTSRIREVLGKVVPQRVPLAPSYIGGVVPYRGDVLTTICTRSVLGLEDLPGARCVLVLEDEEMHEPFGLMVDSMGVVVSVSRSALRPSPDSLDARTREIFAGAYTMDEGLIVQLDPQQLRPSRLAESALFRIPAELSTRTKGEYR